jgi:hypothetical protein
VGDVCRQIGISEATFYTWKKKYAGLGVSELRKLKMLEDENARLKRIVVDLTLDSRSCRRSDEKSSEGRPSGASWRPGCKSAPRSACDGHAIWPSYYGRWYTKSQARDQSALRHRIRDIVLIPNTISPRDQLRVDISNVSKQS